MDDYIDRLKQDKRFNQNTPYRRNVLAMMRLRDANIRSQEIVKRVLTLQEEEEALSAEFLLLNGRRNHHD